MARRRLCRRMRKDLYPLAYAWTGHPFAATRAVRAATRSALLDHGRPFSSAVVAALHRQTRGRAEANAGSESGVLQRAVTVLCDDRRLPPSAAALLLGLSPAQVASHHRAGREALGLGAVEAEIPRCAGWAMVCRDQKELTSRERAAVTGHLGLCRTCRDGLTSRRRARRALHAGGVIGGGGAIAAAALACDSVLTAAGPVAVAGGIGVLSGMGVTIEHVAHHLPPSHDRPAAAHVVTDRHPARPTTERGSTAASSNRPSGGGDPATLSPAPNLSRSTPAGGDLGSGGTPSSNGALTGPTGPTSVGTTAPVPTVSGLPPLTSLVPLPLPSGLVSPVPLPALPSLLPPLASLSPLPPLPLG